MDHRFWMDKQARKDDFCARIKKFVIKADLMAFRSLQKAYYKWIRFAQRLALLEKCLSQKQATAHKERVFFYWMATYQQQVELTRGLFELQMKQKVWF